MYWIEVLSPTNKLPGDGRRQYETKRRATLGSFANLVEIDLLRVGEPLPMSAGGEPVPSGEAGYYRVLVSRAAERPQGDLFVSGVAEPLPTVPIPLRPAEPEPVIDLQSLMAHVYALGRYERRIDYRAEPVPALPPAYAEWANRLLRAAGRRQPPG